MLDDINQRQEAKYNFTQNIFVEAGAGTGKTRLLTERITNWLLLSENGDITKLVALTFTEKAAAEIKLRILKRLNRTADVLNGVCEDEDSYVETMLSSYGKTKEELLDRIYSARENIEHSRISTIHAFALFLLRLYPLEAGISPSVKADDGENALSVFEKSWKTWLEEELGPNPKSEEDWRALLNYADIKAVEEFAQGLCFSPYSAGGPKKFLSLGAAYAREKAQQALALYEEFAAESKPLKLDITLKEVSQYLLNCADAAEKGEILEGKKWTVDKPAKKWQEAFDKYEEAVCIVKYASSVSAVSQQALTLAFKILEPFRALYNFNFEKANYISFDDILLKARNLLRDNPSVRQELKRSFSFILIDEFQDTDPLQGEILFFLAERADSFSKAWEDLELEAGKLFVVGDPKQSVYRFRGADILAYDEFKKHILKQNGLFLNISVNFRSEEGVVAFVNESLKPVMKESYGVQPVYVPISAHNKKTLDGNAVELITVVADSKINSDAARLNYAGAAADWIYENCIKTDRFKLKDIAVLTRKRSIFEHFISVFKTRGIKYSVEDDKLFYTAGEILDLLSLLKLIDDPLDLISLTAVLRSPLCMISDGEILALAENGKLNCAGDFNGNVFLQNFFGKLLSFSSAAQKTPLSDFVADVADAFCVRETLSLYYNGEQTVFNINKFLAGARYSGETSPSSLSDFIALSKLYTGGLRQEGESPAADEYLDAVNIMTIHKSKGLEFNVVILPELDRALSSNKRNDLPLTYSWKDGVTGYKMASYCDLNAAAMADAQVLHSRAEEVRLFYVALTRAKKKILLLNTTNKPEKNSMALMLSASGHEFLTYDNCNESAGENIPAAGKFIALKTQQEILGAQTQKTESVDFSSFDKELWHKNIKEKEAEYNRYLKLKKFTAPSARIVADDEADEIKHYAGGRAKLIGLICHKFLENYDFKTPFSLETLRACACGLSYSAVINDYEEALRESFSILIKFSQSGLCKEFAGFKLLCRELPFSAAADGKLVRGIIDSVTEEGGALVINDYKTDDVAMGRENEEAQKYLTQCSYYKEALLKIYPSKTVKCRIVFLRTCRAVWLNI